MSLINLRQHERGGMWHREIRQIDKQRVRELYRERKTARIVIDRQIERERQRERERDRERGREREREREKERGRGRGERERERESEREKKKE